MKRALLVVLLAALLGAPSAFAQVGQQPGVTSPFKGGTITGPILGATGCTTPPYSFTVDTDAGLCVTAANGLQVQSSTFGTTSSSQLTLTSSQAAIWWKDAGAVLNDMTLDSGGFKFFFGGKQTFTLSATAGTFGAVANVDPISIVPIAKGAAANTGTLTSADLTNPRTWTLPDVGGGILVSGTYAASGKEVVITNTPSAGDFNISVDSGGAGTYWDLSPGTMVIHPQVYIGELAGAYDPILIQPVAKGAASNVGTLTSDDLTAAHTWTIPDATAKIGLNNVRPITIPDSGGAGAATYTLDVTPNVQKEIVIFTCADADGCTVTMGETSIADGQTVQIVNVSANAIAFADTAGVSETAGAFSAGQYDVMTLMYAGATWIEVSRSNN